MHSHSSGLSTGFTGASSGQHGVGNNLPIIHHGPQPYQGGYIHAFGAPQQHGVYPHPLGFSPANVLLSYQQHQQQHQQQEQQQQPQLQGADVVNPNNDQHNIVLEGHEGDVAQAGCCAQFLQWLSNLL